MIRAKHIDTATFAHRARVNPCNSDKLLRGHALSICACRQVVDSRRKWLHLGHVHNDRFQLVALDDSIARW